MTVGGEQVFAASYRDRELITSRTDWNGAIVDEPVAPHPGLSNATCGFVMGDRETAFVLDSDANDGGVFTAYACAGPSFQRPAIARIFLNELPAAVVSPAIPIPMVFHDPDMICGIGRNLCFVRPGTTARFEEPPEPIEQIIASPRHSLSRVIFGMARGGFVTWGGVGHASRATFASDMVAPRIAHRRSPKRPPPLPGSPKRKLREYASLHRKPLRIPSARAF